MKRKILFVDDDPVLLRLYAMMLEEKSDEWEVETSESAEQALDLIKERSFDVVVSDMNMPGMSGLEFIRQVKRYSPATSRIIISALADQEQAAQTLRETHQFLSKPFEGAALFATLDRIHGLDTYLRNDKLQSLVGRLHTLPSFPSLYLQIMTELAQPEPSIENLAGIVAKDPSMTARILQLANSPVLGLRQSVSNPSEAVMYLGMGVLKSLALSAKVFSKYEDTKLRGFSFEQVWEHSVRTARIAKMIMTSCEVQDSLSDDAYSAAMMHDIGRLMLAHNLPKAYQESLDFASAQQVTMEGAELSTLYATHAGVGAYLLGLWGLPATIVEAVAFHHTPSLSDTRGITPLMAVHVANAIEHRLRGLPEIMDEAYLEEVGIPFSVDEWRAEAANLLG